jgi:septal ring-binding cell division protein DamX
MRDSHRLKEKYELSLDNRQIVTLAVASLVVLGGVFTLGVVVGKKLSGEQPDKPATDLLSQLDQKTAALDDASLTFQDELTKKAPVAIAAPPTPAPTPKPEPVKPAAEVKPAPVAALVPPLPDPKEPAPAVAVVSPPAPDEAPAATSLPEAPKAEPVATRTHDGGGLKEAFGKVQRPPTPTETAADGAWTLQLSAYQDRAEAERFAAGLRDKGYAPFIVEANLAAKGTWYRVRMGRFANKDAATRYLTDFKRETSMNALVTNQ